MNSFKKFLKIFIVVVACATLLCFLINLGFKITKHISEKNKLKLYNETKQIELEKMVSFVNEKYDYDFNINDCVYYREEDYSRHEDFLGNGRTYNIPYISVFEKDDIKITVTDRKGFLSDDGQLDEINFLVADYFSNITASNIDFVQIRYVGNGNIEDDTINHILQYDFNQKITSDNIDAFLDKVFNTKSIELIFYTKYLDKNAINNLTKDLSYLKDYSNIRRVMIYFYDKNEELIISSISKKLDDEYKKYNTSDDYNDDYKFDYIYVPNNYEYFYSNSPSSIFKNEKFNTFISSAYLDLKRGYSAMQGGRTYEVVNDWFVYSY